MTPKGLHFHWKNKLKIDLGAKGRKSARFALFALFLQTPQFLALFQGSCGLKIDQKTVQK